MVVNPIMLILVVLALVALSSSGYGYYNGGGYASPLGFVGMLLLVGLIMWLLLGGALWLQPPPTP